MTLPASGQITMSQVDTELSRGSTVQVSLGETAVRNLAGISSGQISLASLYGKSSASVVSQFGGNLTASKIGSTAVSVSASFNGDGTLSISATSGAGVTDEITGDRWYNPTTASIGNSYYIKARLVSGSTPTSGIADNSTWQNIGVNKSWNYNSGTGGALSSRSGTIEFQIAASAGGTVLATGSIYFEASRES